MTHPFRQQGFTLLEVLLVIVLMGLAAALIAPTLPRGSGVQQLQRETDRFLELARITRQKALMDGQSLGLSLTQKTGSQADQYQFSLLKKGEWQNLERDRLLRPVTLPDDISLSVSPGDSFWQKAVEYEQESGSAGLIFESGEKTMTPDIYFWSSGEVSPAHVRLCLMEKQAICREVELSETGQVSIKAQTDG